MLNVHPAEIGNLCIIHDIGPYGCAAMGLNFNAKLQHAEILRVGRKVYEMIRRPQTFKDYFATMVFPSKWMVSLQFCVCATTCVLNKTEIRKGFIVTWTGKLHY